MLRSRRLPTGRPTLREAGASTDILGRHWEHEKAKENIRNSVEKLDVVGRGHLNRTFSLSEHLPIDKTSRVVNLTLQSLVILYPFVRLSLCRYPSPV